MGLLADQLLHGECGEERRDELRNPVCESSRPWQVATYRKGERHGRVEVCPGHVADRVDHHHHDEPERERDADVSQRVGLRVHDDGSAAGEHEREGPDEFGER